MALKGISDAARKKKGLWRSSADLMYVLTMTEELAEASMVMGTPGMSALGKEGAESRVKRWFARQDECGCIKCWLGQGPGCGVETVTKESGECVLQEPAVGDPEPAERATTPEAEARQRSTEDAGPEKAGRAGETTPQEEARPSSCPKCLKKVVVGWTCSGSCRERWHKQCIARARPRMKQPPAERGGLWWCGRCAEVGLTTDSLLPDQVDGAAGSRVKPVDKERCNYPKCKYKSLPKKPLRCHVCGGVWHQYCAIDREGRPNPPLDEDGDELPWWCGSCSKKEE